MQTEWKRLNKKGNFNIKKCSYFLTIPNLLFKKRAFLRVDGTGTQIKEDTLEVNNGKSLNCDSLSLGSLTAEGSKLTRLLSGEQLVSLIGNILDCITST